MARATFESKMGSLEIGSADGFFCDMGASVIAKLPMEGNLEGSVAEGKLSSMAT